MNSIKSLWNDHKGDAAIVLFAVVSYVTLVWSFSL
jgi:hypothetical protein